MQYQSLEKIKQIAYEPNQIAISNYNKNKESQEYEACTFTLLNKQIIFRKAKITPNKAGHFVTTWKRENGATTPLDNDDAFDFLIISTEDELHFGQFIFDKKILLQQGIISSNNKKGKRGMRVYAPWTAPNNQTALKTKAWQCKYFINFDAKPAVILFNIRKLFN
jgi:hypothetical protein